MNGHEVSVLRAGYATPLGPTRQRAGGTITLVTGPTRLIVDTGGPQERGVLLDGLKSRGISAAEIDFVVCTHGHGDHVGNNNLFPDATFIVCYDVCRHDVFSFHDFRGGRPYVIDEGVEVIPTPGHTAEDVSVMVRTAAGVYAITGDLFEHGGDEEQWAAFSTDPEQQRGHRRKILGLADVVVPGHGPAFAVP